MTVESGKKITVDDFQTALQQYFDSRVKLVDTLPPPEQQEPGVLYLVKES